MKVAVFSSREWVRQSFDEANGDHHFDLTYFDTRLDSNTAALAENHGTVCAFVNDDLSADVLTKLSAIGVSLVAMRCAGFNNVDTDRANELGMTVVRVPAYSPDSVAEHTIGLMLTLNRRYHRAHWRIREGNFSLDGLLGFDINGKTIGIIGTGRIGKTVARKLCGFGCRLLGYDRFPDEEWASENKIEYVDLDTLLGESEIISLHCPLTHDTRHMIDSRSIGLMKDGVMLINTSRGALVDTKAVIGGLKSGKIGYLGLDVYEEESDLFFKDLSEQVIQDDTFVRLETFPNVLITAHQGFFTREAVANIAATTLQNISDFQETGSSKNAVTSGQR